MMAEHDKAAILLLLARQAIALQLGMGVDERQCMDIDWLNEDAATFVTLTQHQALRGCIGSLEAYRPLRVDVQANAVAAAFHDPRFSPLTIDEYAGLRLEVSLLTALQGLDVVDENDALEKIRPGLDGVVLQCMVHGSMHKATFLPQVWDQLSDPVQFMNHLKVKAGLKVDDWHSDMCLFVYQVHQYCEPAEGAL
ncbi:MAG: AmmeMemoRadiSam system protein A [Mariprofundus sp.]|nr:AmmeMemoRadiSam system protein A [Mariprofundus sp.]